MIAFKNLHDTIMYVSKTLKNILNNRRINESENELKPQPFYAEGDGYVVRRICLPKRYRKYNVDNRLTVNIRINSTSFGDIIKNSLEESSEDGISVIRDYISKNIFKNYSNVRTSFVNNRVTDDTINNILEIFKWSQIDNTNDYLEFITTCDLTRKTIHACANGDTFAVACFRIEYLEENGISVISAPSSNNENHSLLIDSDFLNAKKNVITDYSTLETFVNKNPRELLNALIKIKDNGKSTINFLTDKIYNDVYIGNCHHLMSTKFNDIDHFVVCNYRDYDILNFRNNEYNKFHMNVRYKDNAFHISDSR